MVGVELRELLRHGVADIGKHQRVLPEVRIGLVGVDTVLAERHQVDYVVDVEDVALGVLIDRVVDGRLEATLVDDQVGVDDLGGLVDRELEVVRLLARLGEVLDRGQVAGHPLRDVLQRVERRRDPQLAIVPTAVVGEGRAARGREGKSSQEENAAHENHSQS